MDVNANIHSLEIAGKVIKQSSFTHSSSFLHINVSMKTHFRCSHMRISYYEFLKSHQNIDLGAKRRFFFLHFLLERIAQSQENLQLEVVCFAFCDN